MKKILICGMLLGFLTAVGWAQRVAPGVRTPIAVGHGGVGTMGMPGVGAASMSHAGVYPGAATRPNAVTTPSKSPKTIKPNAASDPRPSTVDSHTETVKPNRPILPNSHDGVGPNQ
jgi:hypothetical protein